MDYKDMAALLAIPLTLGAGIGAFAVKKPAACIKVMAAIKTALLIPAACMAGAWFGAWWVLRNTTKSFPVRTVTDVETFLLDVKCFNSKLFQETTVLPSIDWLVWIAGVLAVCWALSESGYRLALVIHATDQDGAKNKSRSSEDVS